MNPWGGRGLALPDRPSASWSEIVEAGMRTVLFGAVLIGIIPTVALARDSVPHLDLRVMIGLALLAAAQAVMLWTLARGTLGAWSAATVAVLMVVGLSLAVPAQGHPPQSSNAWWPRAMLIATPGYLIGKRTASSMTRSSTSCA